MRIVVRPAPSAQRRQTCPATDARPPWGRATVRRGSRAG
jgi:hypothetical protein